MGSPKIQEVSLGTKRIKARIDGQIGQIILDRPEKRNAVSYEMWSAIPDVVNAFRSAPGLRCVVISGTGDQAFSAGSDISEFKSQRSSVSQVMAYEQVMGTAISALKDLNVPLIAKIRGYCIGGGMAMALAADIRIASTNSVFSIPAARLGLGYDYDGLKDIVALVGPALAKEMLFTGRRYSSEEAVRLGFVNSVVPDAQLEPVVEELLQSILSNAPLTIYAAKCAIDATSKSNSALDRAHIEKLVAACFESEDYKEGWQAFMEKRPPQFSGR